MSQELTPVLTQEAQPIQTSAMALAPMALAEQYLTELNLPIEQAAQAILKGWAQGAFEVHFPKRFTLWLKALRLLPNRAYFHLVRRTTS